MAGSPDRRGAASAAAPPPLANPPPDPRRTAGPAAAPALGSEPRAPPTTGAPATRRDRRSAARPTAPQPGHPQQRPGRHRAAAGATRAAAGETGSSRTPGLAGRPRARRRDPGQRPYPARDPGVALSLRRPRQPGPSPRPAVALCQPLRAGFGGRDRPPQPGRFPLGYRGGSRGALPLPERAAVLRQRPADARREHPGGPCSGLGSRRPGARSFTAKVPSHRIQGSFRFL